MSEAEALARWLIALEVVGWGLYPFLYLATPGLRDRGLTLAKPFALLLLTYPAWFLASFGLPLFTAPALAAALVGLSAVGWALATRQGRPLLPFLRTGWRYVLAVEALFLASFLAYAWVRGYNPQILGTEKPMESGFLSAAVRGTTMPPPDPWLSGYGINYYYLGYVIFAAVAKLTAIEPSVAFNLALATLFAASLVGATGLTTNLLARASGQRGAAPRLATLGAGLLGGYLLALAGNMYAAVDILRRGREAIDVWWWGGLGWKSSRVVIDSGFPERFFGSSPPLAETINEFPYFSFILGDLHAHVLALPFTLLALGLALDVWLRRPRLVCPPGPPILGGDSPPQVSSHPIRRSGPDASLPPGLGGRGGAHSRAVLVAEADPATSATDESRTAARPALPIPVGTVGRVACAALVIGALYALNSWDLPTYAAIYLGALVLPAYLRGGVPRRLWALAAGFVALCVLLFVPYYLHFTSLVGGQPFELPEPIRSWPLVSRLSALLGVVVWGKTPPDQFFTIYLLPYVVGLLFLAWLWRRERAKGAAWTTPALVLLGLGFGATILQMPVLFLAGLLVALAVAIGLRRPARTPDRFAAFLIGAAFALVLVTEVFFIHDVFSNRMNTVFKVYYQAWTLLAVAAGYALARAIFRWRPGAVTWRLPASLVALLLLLASTAYPVVGTWARTEHFERRTGLDGLAFVREVFPDEYAGIQWVLANAPPGSVVAEAPGCSYGEWYGLPHDRVSTFAGVSTPLGWGGHEQQWRGGAPDLLAELEPRRQDINLLFSTTDPAVARQLLDRYGIAYVYVGVYERNGYAAGGIGAECTAGPPYPAAGLAKFDTLMQPVFTQGRVTIYARRAP